MSNYTFYQRISEGKFIAAEKRKHKTTTSAFQFDEQKNVPKIVKSWNANFDNYIMTAASNIPSIFFQTVLATWKRVIAYQTILRSDNTLQNLFLCILNISDWIFLSDTKHVSFFMNCVHKKTTVNFFYLTTHASILCFSIYSKYKTTFWVNKRG